MLLEAAEFFKIFDEMKSINVYLSESESVHGFGVFADKNYNIRRYT